MRKLIILLPIIGLGLLCGACGSSEATATKEEEEHFRNPSKVPPPEAGGPTGAPGAPAGATYDASKMGPPPEALKGPVAGQNAGK